MTEALITVKVQPKASRDEIVGWQGDVLRLRVTAAPEGGRANAAVAELVAEALDVAKTRVSVARGRAGRTKILRVEGLGLAEALDRLGRYTS